MAAKLVCAAMIVYILAPTKLLGQNEDNWQIIVAAGAHSPSEEEIQNIYGGGFIGTVGFAMPLGELGRIQFRASHVRHKGDPFYRLADFNAGEAAKLTLTGLSFTIETRTRGVENPRLHFGFGVGYVFAREKIVRVDSNNGSSIGAHISLAPEIRVSEKLSIMAEASYQLLEVTFTSGRDRYQFDLNGASLLMGLVYDLKR